jgi:hypothetical protein
MQVELGEIPFPRRFEVLSNEATLEVRCNEKGRACLLEGRDKALNGYFSSTS